VLISYLRVTTGLPFPRIAKYLLDFFNVSISTAGLSSHVIRVSKIMNDVYDEILQDVKNGSILYADKLRKISFSRFLKASLVHYIRTGKPLLLKVYAESIALDKAS